MIKRSMSQQEAKRETRFIWTMTIVIVVIVAIALYGYLTGAWEQQPSPVVQ